MAFRECPFIHLINRLGGKREGEKEERKVEGANSVDVNHIVIGVSEQVEYVTYVLTQDERSVLRVYACARV